MEILIISIMWLLFFSTLFRSIWTKRIWTAPSRRFLLQIFLSCLALSFWGKEAEAQLDQYFYHLPVGVYLKYFVLLWVVHLFDAVVRESIDYWQERFAWLKSIIPLAFGLGILSFILYAFYQPIDKALLRYWVIGARDAWILPINLLIFMPAVFILWKREEVLAMRFRLLCSLITAIAYLITIISSIAAAILANYSLDLAAQAAAMAKPFVIVGALAFIPVFIPHRGLNIVTHLRRFYTYHRLRQLREQIVPKEAYKTPLIKSLTELDLAIYQDLIAILDYYPPLETQNQLLYQRIHHCVASNKDYEDLLQAMVQI
jgi:hypothetical protein